MIIKKIILENIRSYKKQEVEFPEGSTLLSGDIGSGKTSILLAIEFAFFGLQPGQRGASLLRNGEEEGRVVLEFEISNKNVIIERTLKRGKTVSQSYCAISINGEKREISVTELKDAVLELLNYPKEFSKKQNILYKFTVYTPQEEMKQIILQDPETRINTLRHVFGIDKYKRIIENINIVLSKIREEKRIKQALASSMEYDKEALELKTQELEKKKLNLIEAEKELSFKEENRKKVEEELSEISKKIEEKNKLQQEIEKTKIMISNKKISISDNIKTISDLENQIAELEQMRFDESLLEKLNSEISSIKDKRNNLSEKIMEISSQINALNFKNNENENIKEKLTHIEVCPTCMQDVNVNYKNNVISKLNSNTEENKNKILKLNSEKNSITNEISQIDKEVSEKEIKITELQRIKIKLESIEEKQEYLTKIKTNNKSLSQDIELLDKHLSSLKTTVLEMKKFDNFYELTKEKFDKISAEAKASEIKVAELKKEIEFFSNQIEELKLKIEKSREIEKQINYLSELENWISKKFIPIIYSVEKNVMNALKSEFSNLFQEWFSMLVSDSFNVRLRDDFTPVIEQQDYELDYSYLSGGERTAIALAYRLALNQVINSLLSRIKTRDIVILDEPTDGFSEAQLDKMRDVLEELNVAQLIIVSHEQKIEGFVENVIKLKKDSGVSKFENYNI